MTEEYIHSHRKRRRGSKTGEDADQRRKRMLNELGSPKEMSSNFKSIYHPNSLIDYLLILIPYSLYPVFQYFFYNRLIIASQWTDVRLYIILYLPLIVIGLWRRSAALALFWITVLTSQLFMITTQSNGFYGSQTIIWTLLLLVLLALAVYLIWKYRNDLQIVIFGLMSLTMCILGRILSILNLTDYSLGPLSRSLVIIYSYVNSMAFYGLMAAMALFILSASRQVRWLGLAFMRS